MGVVVKPTEIPVLIVRMMFVGVRQSPLGETAYVWATIPEGKELEMLSPSWYGGWGKPLVKGVKPGMVYEFQKGISVADSVVPSTARYIGFWHDKDEVARLQATHEAETVMAKARQAEKRDQKRKLHFEVLEPLRRAYWAASPAEQLVIMARVARALSSRKPLVTQKDRHED